MAASTGQVSFALANIPVAAGLLTTGALRPLATGSRKRMSALPQTPTFAELLGDPNFEVGAWYGFVVPTGTPPPVIARLREAIIKVLAEPALRQQVEKALGGGTGEIEDTAKFQARIRSEKESYAKLVAELGLMPK